jgi:uncharacterized iron-regulated membrane protein
MWIFLLLLAAVPMVYHWSDNIVDMFPSLQTYLPSKSHTSLAHPAGRNVLGATGAGALSASDVAAPAPVVSKWAERQTSAGYVAWSESTDGSYRIAAGCHVNEAPSLQFSAASGQSIPATLTLRYPYGSQTLQDGLYRGSDIISTVAQLKAVTVTSDAGVVLASFNLDGVRSNLIARALQANCADSDAASQ